MTNSKRKIQNHSDENILSDNIVNDSVTAYAKIKVTTKNGKTSNRIEEIYKDENRKVSFCPKSIKFKNKLYHFNFPIHCSFEKEDGYYVIQYELLDLIGAGKNEKEAEDSFSEAFDFLYNKLINSSDTALSQHLLRVKNTFMELVSEIN